MKKLVLSAACALLAAGPALAQDADAQGSGEPIERDMVVTYDDLDLTKGRDQRVLKKRLDKAAKIVCQYQEVRTGSRTKSSDAVRCYREAKARNLDVFDSVMDQYRKGG